MKLKEKTWYVGYNSERDFIFPFYVSVVDGDMIGIMTDVDLEFNPHIRWYKAHRHNIEPFIIGEL